MEKRKPSAIELTAVLQNLASCMETSAIMLRRYGLDDKASELTGARVVILAWIEDIGRREAQPDTK